MSLRFVLFLFSILVLAGCTSKFQTVSKNEVEFDFADLSLEDGDYEYTGTVSAKVDMNYFLYFASENNLNYRRGDFGVRVDNLTKSPKLSDRTFDYAMYRLAKENPDVDYFTNVRVEKRVEEKTRFLYITWVRNSKMEVKARAIELKTDK